MRNRLSLALAALALTVVVFTSLRARPSTAQNSSLVLAGTLEGRTVTVAAEVAGRVVGLYVQEGDSVEPGQSLVRLDDSLLREQIAQAEAGLAEANARLAGIESVPRPQELAAAQAAVVQAQSAADSARQRWDNAVAMRETPQELDMKVDAAQAALEQIEIAVTMAEAELRKAEVLRDGPHAGDAEGKTAQAAHAALAEGATATLVSVQTRRNGAAAVLEQLQAIRQDPVELNAAVHRAQRSYAEAMAALAISQAQYDAVQTGAIEEEIALARSHRTQAEARLATLKVQWDKTVLSAPLAAVVSERSVSLGEAVLPGAHLLTLTDFDRVDMYVYVPEQELGRVALGGRTSVQFDALPDESFVGTIAFISPQAEFTPRNVQTPEDRARTVFGVKIQIENPEHVLRPGMTGEVVFE